MEKDQVAPQELSTKSPEDQSTKSLVSNHRGYIPIILGVIVLMLIIGGAGAFFMGTKNKSTFVQPTISPKQSVVEKPTPTPIWKLHDNGTISFEYPSNLIVMDGDFTAVRASQTGGNIVLISAANLLPSSTIPTIKITQQNVIVAGISAKQYTITQPGNGDTHMITVVPHNSDNISIESAPSTPVEVYQHLLSTLKFTDQNQTIDTSNWKTYKDSQYNFSIQYPSTWYADKHGDVIYIDANPIPSMALTHGIPTSLSIFIQPASKAEEIKSNENIQVYDTTVAGNKGLKIVSIQPSNVDGSFGTTYNVTNQAFNYMLSFQNKDVQGKHNATFDQIVSTFKFTQ